MLHKLGDASLLQAKVFKHLGGVLLMSEDGAGDGKTDAPPYQKESVEVVQGPSWTPSEVFQKGLKQTLGQTQRRVLHPLWHGGAFRVLLMIGISGFPSWICCPRGKTWMDSCSTDCDG